MEHKFIIDKEINLNDSDFLKTKIYSKNMTDIINNSVSNKVFTIGLFGNWGTGKSSLIKTSENDFETENKKKVNKEKQVKFITYDAWQYVNDSFRRMFLRKLREGLKYEETDLMKKFYENESTIVGSKYQLSSTRLTFIICGLIILLIILIFLPFNIEFKIPVYAIFTLLGLLITIISGAFHQLKISVTKPYLFAPEQFEECFKEIASNSLSKTNKVLKWIKDNNSIQNLYKLVIVIDNIDRCSNDVAYNLLTDIKTFLSSEPYSIVFVIPVDDEALKNHIIKNSKGDTDCNKEKEEFLRKFFNVTIRIKPYGETDMYAFAKQICEKSKLNFKPDTINVASKEFATNPRRIIQLLNNLLAEMNYYDVDFAKKNETLICCILIIREEYPEYYKAIINAPKIFNDEYQGDEEYIKRFIRIAQTALGKIEIANLSRVLTNSYHQFDDIATDIKDAIETFNAEKVLSVWNQEKERISDYIFDRLDNAIKNNLIDTDLVAYFDLIAQINAAYPIETHFTKKIDEKIVPYLSTVISKTKNHDNLCKYALSREEQGYCKLKEEIIRPITIDNGFESRKYMQSLFTAVLIHFNDKESLMKLSPIYNIHHSFINKAIDFSEEQFEYLISDKYIQDRLDELPRQEDNEILLDTETEEYQKIKWLFENKKNISTITYDCFFAKIIGTTNYNLKMIGKSVDDIAEILDFSNPILKLIPDKRLKEQPQSLYNLIVNDRWIISPRYVNSIDPPLQEPYYRQNNFIDECIATDSHIQNIIDFVINIYRISNNNTKVKNEIDKLLKKYSLNKEFVQLIEKKFTLQPILDSIFDTNDNFSDKDRLAVLLHCFNQEDNKGIYIIADAKSKEKLDKLLTYAQKENSTEVFSLLETLIAQEHYKSILTTLIVAKDSFFANSLPQQILKLAITSFKKENCNDYADNFEFLSVIMQNGTIVQKGYVVKILSEKLDDNQDLEQTLNLIDTMENISDFDSSGLLHSHLDRYQKDNKDSIMPDISDKIKGLKEKTKINK
ncbi:putative P-loop ATPase [Bacteroidales bacterium Barb4]|nr:putative P-loop ATPase [Bacteroidales bacterium Barb4]